MTDLPNREPEPTEPECPPETTGSTTAEPSYWAAYQRLMYGLSFPERAIRSTTALVGGAIQEAGLLLVPQAFRTSRSYSVFIQQSLDFVLTHVGGVERKAAKADGAPAASSHVFLARKAIGGFLDLAGMATLHVSPMALLAIVSDVAYGSQTYLKELSDELKTAGVIDESSSIHHAADLLDAVRKASHRSSELFDSPPLSVDGLKETIAQTTNAVRIIDPRKLIPRSEMEGLWTDIRDIATREGVSPLEVSSSLALYTIAKVGVVGQGALSSAKVAGNLFERHIFDHYRRGLGEIRQKGLYAMVAETYQPYVDAVWSNFSSSKTTVTEELFSGRMVGRAWGAVTKWFGTNEDESATG